MESNNKYLEIDTLVIKAQGGDTKSLSELKKLYKQAIKASLRRCFKKLPEIERYSEDLEADTNLVFREVVMGYDPKLSYFSWYLPRFLDYAIISRAKKEYLKEAHHLSIDQISEEIQDERQADPFGQILENIDLNRALATLGEKQRRAITLYYFDGLTQEAAAAELQITQASFCKRLQRALNSLKDVLS